MTNNPQAIEEEKKAKKRAADRAWYAANQDKVKAYRAANREKRAAQKKAWDTKNREHVLAKAREYYWEHREDIRAYQKQRYDADPEKYRAYTRNHYARNAAQCKAYARIYYRANRDHVLQWAKGYWVTNKGKIHARNTLKREAINARHRAWRRKNPTKDVDYNRRRRAHILHAPRNDLTNAQWSAILHHYKHVCVYCPPTCKACKQKTHQLTQDHITPLSKGGSHTASNIVPACRSCNTKKHTGPPLKPVQPLLLSLTS